MNAELIAIGFVVGVLVGLTGVGGGSIMTPLLIALNISPIAAVGTDLLYSVPTKLFGAFLHHRQRTINWQLVLWLCVGGFPATIVGAVALIWMRHHIAISVLQSFTKHAVGVALVISALIIIATPWLLKNEDRENGVTEWTPALRSRLIAIGVVVGLIVTITSIGSGSVTLPLLAILLPFISLRTLVGTDIAFAAILIPTAFLSRWSMGGVNIPLAVNLIAGSMPGVFLGTKLCAVFQQRYLRPALAVTLVVVGARMALSV